MQASSDTNKHDLSFIRGTAAPYAKDRDEAFEKIQEHLENNQLSFADYEKIWKGLILSLWSADKVAYQVDLASRIAGLLKIVANVGLIRALVWIKAAFVMLTKEWNRIDQIRINKFLALVRFLLKEIFEFIQANNWNKKIIIRINKLLIEEIFLNNEQYLSTGLELHITQIFISVMQEYQPDNGKLYKLLLTPFLHTLANTQIKSVRIGILDKIFREFVDLYREPEGGAFKNANIKILKKKVLAYASSRDIREENRKTVYDAYSIVDEANTPKERTNEMAEQNEGDSNEHEQDNGENGENEIEEEPVQKKKKNEKKKKENGEIEQPSKKEKQVADKRSKKQTDTEERAKEPLDAHVQPAHGPPVLPMDAIELAHEHARNYAHEEKEKKTSLLNKRKSPQKLETLEEEAEKVDKSKKKGKNSPADGKATKKGKKEAQRIEEEWEEAGAEVDDGDFEDWEEVEEPKEEDEIQFDDEDDENIELNDEEEGDDDFETFSFDHMTERQKSILKKMYPQLPAHYFQSPKERKKYFQGLNKSYMDRLQKAQLKKKANAQKKKLKFNLTENEVFEFDKLKKVARDNKDEVELSEAPGKGLLKRRSSYV